MTNPAYKPFDLQAAIAGKPIICRDGAPAEFISYREDVTGPYKMVCFVKDEFIKFTKDGSFIASADDGFDLFMAPEKKKVWINVWKQGEYGYILTATFDTEESAASDRRNSMDGVFLETIYREYDI